MNLAALQRVDSAVTEILDNASQVALYKFSAATNGWEKTEIEGALFVFSWSKTPRHGFIVMNRLSTTNLLEVITPDSEFQVQAPYLLYRNSNSGISCIWFYDTKECERIGNVCKSLKRGMAAKSNYRQRCASESDSNHRNHGNAAAGGQNGATRDIVALLAKAKDQYDMKNAGVQNGCSVGNPKGSNGGGRARGGRRNGATSSPPARNNPHPNNKVNNAKNNVAANGSLNTKNDVLFKPTPLRNNGVVAAAVPPNAVESPSTPLTVATLFAAVSGGRASVSPLPAEGKDVCNGGSGGGGGGREVLQELLSNPANLLEHVERMQRNEGGASSGGQASPPADASPRHRAASCVATLSAWEATDDLRQKLRLAPQSNHGSGEPTGAGPATAPLRGSGGLPNRSPPPATGGEMNAGEMFQSPAACDIPLLSPMAFTRSTSLIASSPPSSNSFSASGSPYMNGHVTEALIPPHALSGGRRPNSSSVTPLTKEQFRDALIFMLQTDNDFLVKIHEAYLGSLKSHFSVDVNSILGALGRL